LHLLAEKLDQDHGAGGPVNCLVDGREPCEGTFGDLDAVTRVENALGCDLVDAFHGARQRYDCIFHRCGFAAKGDQTTDAHGGTNGSPALGGDRSVELDEEVPWEQGLRFDFYNTRRFFRRQTGARSRPTLDAEGLDGGLFLPGIGVGQVPIYGAFFIQCQHLQHTSWPQLNGYGGKRVYSVLTLMSDFLSDVKLQTWKSR
jgi:hypothetical protein